MYNVHVYFFIYIFCLFEHAIVIIALFISKCSKQIKTSFFLYIVFLYMYIFAFIYIYFRTGDTCCFFIRLHFPYFSLNLTENV